MSDLADIKKQIYEDDRIIEVLELLGCKYIHNENGFIAGSLPSGNNRRSVQVRNNEKLNSHIRSRGISGDIYTIVSYIKFECNSKDEFDSNLPEAKMWIVDNLGYHDLLRKNKNKNKKEKKDYNSWLHDLKKKRKKKNSCEDIKPNVPIPEDVLNDYLMLPYKKWIDEGISYDTQMEFEVGFDWETKRIITPVRNMVGELIGVKGRAMNDEDERKYLYIEQMNKSIELFGLHKTLPYILEKKEIILFEGYKSVMKSWQFGYRNCASIEGDNISDAQVQLIKGLGLDVKVVLCLDKDKTEKEVQEQIGKITNRMTSYTYDLTNLLQHKDSPVDKGFGVWEELYKSRIDYSQM